MADGRCVHGYLPSAPRCPYGCVLGGPEKHEPTLPRQPSTHPGAIRRRDLDAGAQRKRAIPPPIPLAFEEEHLT